MTVKEKVGRRRYLSFEPLNDNTIYTMVRNIKNSSIVNYKDIKVLRIKHYQLNEARLIASKYNIKINMVSGTLKSLRSKLKS